MDPEIGLNIVDLGLVYNLEVGPAAITTRMTMTSPACPFGQSLADQAQAALRAAFPEVRAISVTLVHDPPWRPEMMSTEGKRFLGLR